MMPLVLLSDKQTPFHFQIYKQIFGIKNLFSFSDIKTNFQYNNPFFTCGLTNLRNN